MEGWFLADWFQEKYVKLSDVLINAVQTEVKTYICEWKDRNESYADQIKNSRDLYYSKKLGQNVKEYSAAGCRGKVSKVF